MRMKSILFLTAAVLGLCLAAFGQEVPTAPYFPAQSPQEALSTPISVQYPYENMKIERGAQKIFIFGHLDLPEPLRLDINGEPVPVSRNGSFIAFLPVQSGTFRFLLTVQTQDQTFQAQRLVNIEGTDTSAYAQKAAFDKTRLFPQTHTELLPSDTLTLTARGTPNAQVTASLSGVKGGKAVALTETPAGSGNYKADFTLPADQKPQRIKVTYKMTNGPKRSKAKVNAPARIKVRSAQEPFTYARVTLAGVKLRKLPTASGNLYPFYRAYGEVAVTGEMNNQYRLRLNDKESAWLEKTRLKAVSAPEEGRTNILSDMHIEADEGQTHMRFMLERPTTVSLREFGDSMQITLYGVDDFVENFSFDPENPLLDRVEWAQTAEKTYSFIAHFKQPNTLWGYRYGFDNNTFKVDFTTRPPLAATPEKPLKGARIVLDAGHNPRTTVPYDGAIGPSGYLEFQGTIALAEMLKPMLEDAGATVLLTRKGDNKMTLQQRYDFAKKNNAHLFVSLHYNALPNTTDPFEKPRGFTVFYAYPHSFELGQSVHEAFIKNVPLPDEGLVLNDVLFIPRMPDFPSILVENAHLIIPEQEELARTPAGQRIFAQALYEGIVNFYNKQLPPETEPQP